MMQAYIEEAEKALLHTYNRYQVVLDKGEGVYLYDIEGKKYLDFVSGIAVFALGYKNQAYNDALKEQIDKDTEAFNLVAAAFKLPKTTDAEKAARSGAIQAGTLVSTQVPFETMELALEALRWAQKLLSGFNDGAASDLGVAAWNLLSCVKGAWLNVCINISSLKDTAKAEDFRSRGAALVQEAEAIAAEITAHTENMICG